jgi:hypothetical protein
MYFLKNNELEVEILDPSIDRKLLGSRYCTGGYIFQIKDKNRGDLMSGPQFSNPKFDVFHGQGAPEVFVDALNEQAQLGEEVLVLGVGIVERTSANSPFHVRDNPKVKEFCFWEIEKMSHSILMKTLHKFNNWQLIINREVALIERTVTSKTTIQNIGQASISIKWFAHPFFPFPLNSIACKFSTPIELLPNYGYFINNQGFIEMRREYDWGKGLFQKIVCNNSNNKELSVIQGHPKVGKVTITSDYIPESLAIWANNATFSFEPFYSEQVDANDTQSWSISYEFDTP